MKKIIKDIISILTVILLVNIFSFFIFLYKMNCLSYDFAVSFCNIFPLQQDAAGLLPAPISALDCTRKHSSDQLFLSNDKDGNGRNDDHNNACDHQGDGL